MFFTNINCSFFIRFISFPFFIALMALNVHATEIVVGSEQGISVHQINYESDSGAVIANTGILDIDLIKLRTETGMHSGYINMSVGNDWVVRNVKVMEESEYPYSRITAEFDLGVEKGVAIATLDNVFTSFSEEALPEFIINAQLTVDYEINMIDYALGGVPDSPITDAPAPPNLTDILFGDPGDTDAITQFDHPNLEAAVNQCMPMSIANSLQYLEDTTDLEIPHEHKMGLKGDNTLVGQLDTHTDRTVISRRSDANSGTWGITGKMSYLAANGLQDQVQTTHMGSGEHSGDDNVSVTVDGKTATATGLGANISFDTLLSSMKEGQDCELVYAWPGGAHAVDAVAAGKTRGQPWIVHASDLNQDSDSLGAGASGFVFEYLTDTDNDGQLNLSGTNKELVQVICEKYVQPEPTVTIIEIDDPAGHSCCVTPPPESVDILLNGSVLTIDGNAPWLPLTGSVEQNGTVTLSSTATVAGFPNIVNTLTGAFDETSQSLRNVVISLGAEGGLPQSQSINYTVDITGHTPSNVLKPVIRSNGFRREFMIDSADPLSLTVELKAGDKANQAADWWVVQRSDSGLQSYNLATGEFEEGLNPTFQGNIIDLPFLRLKLFENGLNSGTHTFYFGLDLNPNGSLDLAELVYDSVTVTVP